MKSPTYEWKQNYGYAICANVIFSMWYVDECWNLEYQYNILYWYFGTLLKIKKSLVGIKENINNDFKTKLVKCAM